MIEKGAANSVIAKRRCLYCFLVGVMFIIATNIGITALLLYYINLSKSSIGDIRLESLKTIINGNLLVKNSVTSQTIKSFNDSLKLVSGGPIEIISQSDPHKTILNLDTDMLMQTGTFKIKNRSGKDILSIGPDKVETKFRSVKLDGKAQALNSLQAEQILSLPSTNMRIASLTKNLLIKSSNHLDLMTSIGNMSVKALKNLKIEAEKIGLGSPHVFMPKIKGLRESGMKNSSVSIFEICLCSDGSMFAADINQGCYDSARESGYCPST